MDAKGGLVDSMEVLPLGMSQRVILSEKVNPGRLLEVGRAHGRSLCARGGGFWFSAFGCMGCDTNGLAGPSVGISTYTASCAVGACE